MASYDLQTPKRGANPAGLQTPRSFTPASRLTTASTRSFATLPPLGSVPRSASIAPSALSTDTFRSNATRTSRLPRPRPRNRRVPALDAGKIDLAAIEDADDVFYVFGVRDVKEIEARASSSIQAKSAQLKAMVGERYRDMLSAADAIVRMSDKCAQLSAAVEDIDARLGRNGADQRPALPDASGRQPGFPPTTPYTRDRPDDPGQSVQIRLALTIQLLLSLPPLVHAQLAAGRILESALLQRFAIAVLHWLEAADVVRVFPIISGQVGKIRALKGAIVAGGVRVLAAVEGGKDASEDIAVKDTSPRLAIDTPPASAASAAIALLENLDAPATLRVFLAARRRHLTSLVSNTAEFPLARVLDAIDDTLRVAGTLQIAIPPTQPAKWLANYSLLERFLPAELVHFEVKYDASVPSGIKDATVTAAEASGHLSAEAETLTAQWLADLGPKLLTLFEHDISRHVSVAALSAVRSTLDVRGEELRNPLLDALRASVSRVYERKLHKLEEIVWEVLGGVSEGPNGVSALEGQGEFGGARETVSADPTPPLTNGKKRSFTLLSSHPLSDSQRVFDEELTFPDSYHGSSATPAFMREVVKRAGGLPVPVESVLQELEAQAEALRVDFVNWDELIHFPEMRGRYLEKVQETLVRITAAMRAHNGLAMGTLCVALEERDVFLSALLLVDREAITEGEASKLTSDPSSDNAAPPPNSESKDAGIRRTWHDTLATLRQESLTDWLAKSVKQATDVVQEVRAREEIGDDSAQLVRIAVLKTLNDQLKCVGVYRLQHDSLDIRKALVDAFAAAGTGETLEADDATRALFYPLIPYTAVAAPAKSGVASVTLTGLVKPGPRLGLLPVR